MAPKMMSTFFQQAPLGVIFLVSCLYAGSAVFIFKVGYVEPTLEEEQKQSLGSGQQLPNHKILFEHSMYFDNIKSMVHGLVEDFNCSSHTKRVLWREKQLTLEAIGFSHDNSTIELFTDTTKALGDRGIYGTRLQWILLPLPFAMTHLKLSALSKCASLAKVRV